MTMAGRSFRSCKSKCGRFLSSCRLRVSRYRILVLLFVLTLVYLYVQYWMLGHVPEPVMKEKGAWSGHPSSYETVYDLLTSFSRSGVDAILLDPDVLKTILNAPSLKKKLPDKCRFLCPDKPFVTLAILENSWRVEVADKLKSLDFDWIELKRPDAKLGWSGFHQKPTVHYLLWRAGYLIHVVVLYQQPGPFLRYSMARFTGGQRLWLERKEFNATLLNFGEFDGALPVFEIAHVKIDNVSLLAPKFPGKLLADFEQSAFVECDRSRAEAFHQQYPRDLGDQAQLFRAKVRSLLTIAKKVLDELQIPFWLSSGTCLGWFRQCDVIPYSLDADIGVRIEDFNQDMITSLENNGLRFHYKFGRLGDSLQLAFLLDQVKLDIYFFYPDGVFMWNGGTHARTGNKYKYLFPKFTLCWTWFLDMLLRVPCETEAYVQANYGDEWGRPVKDWKWRESPYNVRENGQWPRSDWDDVIQIFQ